MFHYVTGIPFQSDLHAGAYDDLTLWEQIDEGAHYTPAKKWLFTVPVVLYVEAIYFPFFDMCMANISFRFLASTHYTHYNPWMFAINISALIFVLIPKLPQVRSAVHFSLLQTLAPATYLPLNSTQLHRQRVRFMVNDEPSGISTPISANFPRSGSTTPTILDDSIPPIKITSADFA